MDKEKKQTAFILRLKRKHEQRSCLPRPRNSDSRYRQRPMVQTWARNKHLSTYKLLRKTPPDTVFRNAFMKKDRERRIKDHVFSYSLTGVALEAGSWVICYFRNRKE